jgi:hypothetical protein
MARSDRREIRNCLIALLIHLLKYSIQPRTRSSGWLATTGEHRSHIATMRLKSFPELKLDHAASMRAPVPP